MDAWISAAEGDTARALRTIGAVPRERCEQVLNRVERWQLLTRDCSHGTGHFVSADLENCVTLQRSNRRWSGLLRKLSGNATSREK